jgi:hypothetical protein
MSDTPETNDIARGNHVVPTEWAEQLERERDQARNLLKHAQSALDAIHLEIGGWIKTMSVTSK